MNHEHKSLTGSERGSRTGFWLSPNDKDGRDCAFRDAFGRFSDDRREEGGLHP